MEVLCPLLWIIPLGGNTTSFDFAELCGVFTVDPEQPVANGRPHYRTAAGGHLYYHWGTGKWFLTDEGYSPDKPNASACILPFAQPSMYTA